jgi:hypothetical protein
MSLFATAGIGASAKTIAGRLSVGIAATVLGLIVSACGARQEVPATADPTTLSRTEFTPRIENYFEYEPLRPGKSSRFLIHLTDLSDGSPVANAEVTVTLRPKSGSPPGQATARVGKVTGIYVADVIAPRAGEYDVEFRIKSARLDERMALTGFKTE